MTTTAQVPVWRRLLYTPLRDVVRGRINGRLDWRQVIAAAGLPVEIADTISETVRRTRLWRSEKVEVALELVSHFQEGLATNRSVKQLAGSFGDVRVASRLIRRAKKRGRPLPWHVARWGAWSLAAMVVLYVLAGLYLLLGRPEIKIDYLTKINARAVAVPEASRAWPLYRQALLALGGEMSRPDRKSSPLVLLQDVKPGDAGWPRAEQLLVEHADAVALLRQAAARASLGLPVKTSLADYSADDAALFQRPASDSPRAEPRAIRALQDRLLLAVVTPHVPLLREAAGVLRTDCRRAAQAGEAEVALANVLAQLAVCRHLQETPFLSHAERADMVRQDAFLSVQEILSEQAELWSTDQLRTLAHVIAGTEIDWRRALDCERAAFGDLIQRVYTDDGAGDGRLTPDAMKLLSGARLYDGTQFPRVESWLRDTILLAALPAANLSVASRRDMSDFYERFLDKLAIRIEAPITESGEGKPDREIDAIGRSQVLALRYLFAGLMMHYASDVERTAAAGRAAQDGVLIGVALELYRREHGAWPASLDTLAPRWMPAVPIDRITGHALRYKVVADRPIVYSVGNDLDDDGGRPLLDSLGQESRGRISRRLRFPNDVRPNDPENDGDWVIWSTTAMPASDWEDNLNKVIEQ